MTNEPGTIDGEIIEEMKLLELMIAFHKKADEKNLKVDFYYPKELNGYLDVIVAEAVWDDNDYRTVRDVYAEAWVDYYVTTFSESTFYTVQDFADFFNSK